MSRPLTDRQAKAYELLRSAGERGAHLSEIEALFQGVPKKKANSWARNAGRDLTDKGLARRLGEGRYVIREAEATPLAEQVDRGAPPADERPSVETREPGSAKPRGGKARARRRQTDTAKRSSRRTRSTKLLIRNFSQIAEADIEFGDLTVLVGPQATGKSLCLQWLKVAIDEREIASALRESGSETSARGEFLDLVFGEGMAAAWTTKTSIAFEGREITPPSKKSRGTAQGAVFFIPAHRALLLAEGWPAPFMKLNADTPVVARLFSQNLYQRFSGRDASVLFPVERLLKEEYRRLIDSAIFHGGDVQLEKEGLRRRLRLEFRSADPEQTVRLPFMTWTAGQREFTPLLLGLYDVLPARKQPKQDGIDWVVIEEPEMGLHPQAIAVFMLLVLDLLWRGYRVVVSTHSPLVLDIVWAIRRIAEYRGDWKYLADAFGVGTSQSVKSVLEKALNKDYRVYFFELDPKSRLVHTRDISNLDPESADPAERDWGGLTEFSSQFGTAVRRAANARPRT